MINRFLRRMTIPVRIAAVFIGLLLIFLVVMALLVVNQMGLAEQLPAAAADAYARRLLLLGLGCLFLVVISAVAVFLLTRSITGAIRDLNIGANGFKNGHLDVSIPVMGGDELSSLAATLNQMTARLAASYADLEQRVAERTRAVEERAMQLQVAAEVARDAASVRQLDSLLSRAVNLIRERFDLYYVGIYLIDDLGKEAVLRAATGEAGRLMIQRDYKLRVGEVGIVGYAISMGAPRIVNDVGFDYVFRRDALLPETQSQMALPLKVGNMVIGALDVHSVTKQAFGDDDLAALQILTDQLALAIQNSRLVGELEERLREIDRLYRRYTQESLTRVTENNAQMGYQYNLLSVQTIQPGLDPELLDRLRAGQMVTTQVNHEGHQRSRLLVPLILYDQIVGVLGFDEDDPNYQWSDDELGIIRAVAGQVIQALENARLLDETQLRTDQLRLLQAITATATMHTNAGELLEEVSQKLLTGLDVQTCSIAMLDADLKTARLEAHSSVLTHTSDRLAPGMRFSILGEPLLEKAIAGRRCVLQYASDNLPFPSWVGEPPAQSTLKGMVILPMVTRDTVLGLIKLDLAEQSPSFSGEDLRWLDQLGSQISSAVEAARSFEQATQRAERERMVSEIAGRIRATLDIESVIRTAVDEIYKTINLSEVSFYLTGSEGNIPVSAGSRPPGDLADHDRNISLRNANQ